MMMGILFLVLSTQVFSKENILSRKEILKKFKERERPLSYDEYAEKFAALKEIPEDFTNVDNLVLSETQLQLESEERKNDLRKLSEAKKALVSGDTRKAEFFLKLIDNKNEVLSRTRDRFLAIVDFIEGRFDEGYARISHKKFSDIASYRETCLLRILFLLQKKTSNQLLNEFSSCKAFTSKYSKNDQFWLENLEFLKSGDQSGITAGIALDPRTILADTDLTRLWLKSGVYFNREKAILRQIGLMDGRIYESKRAREIIAMLYYRTGDEKTAMEFIEDIDSANAENIKGNIDLQNKRYELALGHFKLALGHKENSTNALERLIPLAWKLEQWQDGLRNLSRVLRSETNKSKISLDTAFRIRLEQFEIAAEQLAIIDAKFSYSPPNEIDLMKAYVTLRMGQKAESLALSEKLCKRFNGLHCYLMMNHSVWENLGLLFARTNPIFSNDQLDVDFYRKIPVIEPLQETPVVDQKDIEELDSEEVLIGLNQKNRRNPNANVFKSLP